MTRHRVFVSSRIGTVHHRALNLRIADLCESLGHRVFLPQRDIPEAASAAEILAMNERAVDRCTLAIVVFDRPGTGVAMELARADARGTPIVGYRSAKSRAREHLGMMLEGRWSILPESRRAATLAELDAALRTLRAPRRRGRAR